MRLSLCIPTSGNIEWVMQVLESIYGQNICDAYFEVVITNNGEDSPMKERIEEINDIHHNITYKHTYSKLFMNQVECFGLATGEFVKFVNHRSKLRPGSMQRLLDFMNDNNNKKTMIFFGDGRVKFEKKIEYFTCFEDFINELGYWLTWSGGISFWKDDYERLKKNEVRSELFPHIDLIFGNNHKDNYILDNRPFFEDIEIDNGKKGKYDLFFAFAVEFVSIILELYRKNIIQIDTFLHIKNETEYFIANLYEDYVIKKKECNYDISDYEKKINIFFSEDRIIDLINSRKRNVQDEFERRINNNKGKKNSVVIFGAGEIGRDYISTIGKEKVICILDNSQEKQNTMFWGIPVMPVSEYVNRKLDSIIKLCVRDYNKECIIKQLMELGIKKIDYCD